MPPERAEPKGNERARTLRKELTPAERKLWAYLRGDESNGVNFRRHPRTISGGKPRNW